jgi:hypothetical protein
MLADNPFKRAEDEYFTLKGKLAAGRITREQFEAALRDLMVQDAQGRYWVLGTDSAKWFVREGELWVERDPYANAPMTPPRPIDLPEHASTAVHAPTPSSPPPPYVPPAPYVVPPAAQVPARSSVRGCLVLIVLIVLLVVGGYLAVQSGAITATSVLKTYLNLTGQGRATLEVDNFRDDAIIVNLQQATTPTASSQDSFQFLAGTMKLKAFEVKLLHVQNPGKYRVDFLTDKEGTKLGSCTLTVRGGDQYQFFPRPDKIVVNRANNPSKVGTDFVVSTSSLCR